MPYLSFLTLALKRARERWVLTLLSVGGVALTVGLIASIPIFTESVGMRILKQELAEHAHGSANPPLALRYYRVPSAPETMTMQQALNTGVWLGHLTRREVGLPVARTYTQIGSHALTIRPLSGDTRYKERALRQVRINCVLDIQEQIEIVEGKPFSEADGSDELLVWARPRLLDELGVQIGERYELFNYNAVHPDQPTVFRIAGIWQATDPRGEFWYSDPHQLLELEFLTSLGAFSHFVTPIMPQQIDYSFWYYVLNDRRLRFDDVDKYAKGVELAQLKAEDTLPSMKVDRSPIEPLQRVQGRTGVLERLLFGFSLPVIALLLVFVASIGSISVRYQRSETAIMMSRGTSHSQSLAINALEGLAHIMLGTPLGLLIGLGFARMMSLNTSFLTFDRRMSLPLFTQGLDWHLIALALIFSLLARLVPTFRASRGTVVTYGRERARTRRPTWLMRLMLITMLCLTTGYAYYELHGRGTFGLMNWGPGAEMIDDPLPFLAPTLFIVTLALIVSGIFPLLMRIPDLIGRFLCPSLYLGFRNLSRQSGAYAAPLFLLTLCLSLGTFEASIARSADSWLVDRLRYKAGADYSFMQTIEETEGGILLGLDSWLLPSTEYCKLPGVVDATRVGKYVAVPTMESLDSLHLLGIDRLDFARVAYFRRDYADEPLGQLLNRLAADQDGILVLRSYLDESMLSLGDTLKLDVYVEGIAQRMPFVITGVFDYFPTVYPTEGPAAVANLDHIHDQCGGAQPHAIWLRTEPDVDAAALKAALKQLGVITMKEVDSRALLAEDLERVERIGIYGSLTVGFLAGSLLAWAGLIVYTVASLVERVRRFTILRALGLKISQILATVSVEYLGVILYGLVAGAAAGVATAKLFVPYFQFTEDPSLQVPPFIPQIAWESLLWIVIAYFCVLTAAEALVLLRTTRREAFQALRLGDEE